jgi:hypothetical protein
MEAHPGLGPEVHRAVYQSRLARPGACPDPEARVGRSDREARCPGWAPEARLVQGVMAALVVRLVVAATVVLAVLGAASVLVLTVLAVAQALASAACPHSEPRPRPVCRLVPPPGRPGPRAAWVLAGLLALEIQEIMLAPALRVLVVPVFPGPGCRVGCRPRPLRALPAS